MPDGSQLSTIKTTLTYIKTRRSFIVRADLNYNVSLDHKTSHKSCNTVIFVATTKIHCGVITDFGFMPKIIMISSKDHVSMKIIVHFLPLNI